MNKVRLFVRSAKRSVKTWIAVIVPNFPSASPSPASPPPRQLSNLGRHKLYFEFSIGFEEAKKYRQANGQILRHSQWEDLTCQVYI